MHKKIDLHCPADEYLPHRGQMMLLDNISWIQGDVVEATAVVQPNSLFAINNQMGTWNLLEYMAQTMATWVNWQAKAQGKIPPFGLLLGTRSMKLFVDHVPVGSELRLTAEQIYVSDDGVGQFYCETYLGQQLIATAKINAYQPKNPKEFLKAADKL